MATVTMALQSPSRFKRTVREKMNSILAMGNSDVSEVTVDRMKRALLSIQRDVRRKAKNPSRADVVVSRRDLSVVDFGVGDFYCIHLTTKPSAEVVVGIVDPLRQVSCYPSVLSFTAVNFARPQYIRVLCSDATANNENFSFLEHTVTSTDHRYHKASVSTVVVHIFSAPSAFAWGFGDGHSGQLGMEGPFPTTEPSQIHISYARSAAATANTASSSRRDRPRSTDPAPSPRSSPGMLDKGMERSRTDICSVGCGERHSAFVTSEGMCTRVSAALPAGCLTQAWR